MELFITTAGLGLLVAIPGIINMTGNISSLHWYHRQRVTEENRKPFGRLVGIGTLIIGASLIVFGTLFLVSERTQIPYLVTIGTVILVVCVILGLALSFFAMLKYNKGLF